MKPALLTLIRRCCLVLLPLLLLAGMHSWTAFGPGVVYEIEVTDHTGTEPRAETMEMAVEGDLFKMEILPGSGRNTEKGEAIFRGDRREMVVVDHKNQTYMVINEATLEALAGQMAGAMDEMREAVQNIQIPPEVMAQLPEAERKRIEALLKQQQEQMAQPRTRNDQERTKREYRRTSERTTQHGYPCVKYDVLEDGVKVQELWVTDWDNVTGGDELAQAFDEMADFFEDLFEALGDAFGGGGVLGGGDLPFGNDDTMFEHMKEIGGFPVVTRDFDADGSLESESVLRSARRQRLDPDAFEPPAGYKRQEMFAPPSDQRR